MNQPAPPLPATRSVGWSVVLVLPLLVVTLPITLPIVAFLDGRDRRRRGAAARVTPCVRCGAVLGDDALARADAAWAAAMAARTAGRPGVRFRIVRTLHALCGRCGARYRWDGRTRVFIPLEADGPIPSATVADP